MEVCVPCFMYNTFTWASRSSQIQTVGASVLTDRCIVAVVGRDVLTSHKIAFPNLFCAIFELFAIRSLIENEWFCYCMISVSQNIHPSRNILSAVVLLTNIS